MSSISSSELLVLLDIYRTSNWTPPSEDSAEPLRLEIVDRLLHAIDSTADPLLVFMVQSAQDLPRLRDMLSMTFSGALQKWWQDLSGTLKDRLEQYSCPLTHKLMVTPVSLHGELCDRDAVYEAWEKKPGFSPITGEPCDNWPPLDVDKYPPMLATHVNDVSQRFIEIVVPTISYLTTILQPTTSESGLPLFAPESDVSTHPGIPAFLKVIHGAFSFFPSHSLHRHSLYPTILRHIDTFLHFYYTYFISHDPESEITEQEAYEALLSHRQELYRALGENDLEEATLYLEEHVLECGLIEKAATSSRELIKMKRALCSTAVKNWVRLARESSDGERLVEKAVDGVERIISFLTSCGKLKDAITTAKRGCSIDVVTQFPALAERVVRLMADLTDRAGNGKRAAVAWLALAEFLRDHSRVDRDEIVSILKKAKQRHPRNAKVNAMLRSYDTPPPPPAVPAPVVAAPAPSPAPAVAAPVEREEEGESSRPARRVVRRTVSREEVQLRDEALRCFHSNDFETLLSITSDPQSTPKMNVRTHALLHGLSSLNSEASSIASEIRSTMEKMSAMQRVLDAGQVDRQLSSFEDKHRGDLQNIKLKNRQIVLVARNLASTTDELDRRVALLELYHQPEGRASVRIPSPAVLVGSKSQGGKIALCGFEYFVELKSHKPPDASPGLAVELTLDKRPAIDLDGMVGNFVAEMQELEFETEPRMSLGIPLTVSSITIPGFSFVQEGEMVTVLVRLQIFKEED